MSFYRERAIKSTRKERQCYGCCRTIAVGSEALECAGTGTDGFWSGTYHTDCRKAEIAFNDLKDYRWGDEWYALHEIEFEDWDWLIDEFPAVADRMGITVEKHREAVERHARYFQGGHRETAS